MPQQVGENSIFGVWSTVLCLILLHLWRGILEDSRCRGPLCICFFNSILIPGHDRDCMTYFGVETISFILGHLCHICYRVEPVFWALDRWDWLDRSPTTATMSALLAVAWHPCRFACLLPHFPQNWCWKVLSRVLVLVLLDWHLFGNRWILVKLLLASHLFFGCVKYAVTNDTMGNIMGSAVWGLWGFRSHIGQNHA